MSLFIEWNTDIPEALKDVPGMEHMTLSKEYVEQLLTRAVEAALEREEVTVPVEIGLQIISAQEIRQLNAMYRQIDRVTDVLSFPMLEYAAEEKASDTIRRCQVAGDIDPETGEVCLGDIIICLQRAAEQAMEYGHSIERELAFLSVHSVLHLLGYDHMTEAEEKVMFGKQEEVLVSIGQTRE